MIKKSLKTACIFLVIIIMVEILLGVVTQVQWNSCYHQCLDRKTWAYLGQPMAELKCTSFCGGYLPKLLQGQATWQETLVVELVHLIIFISIAGGAYLKLKKDAQKLAELSESLIRGKN